MHLFTLSTQVPDVPQHITYGTALVLLGVVLSVNGTSIVIRSRLRRRRKW
jgi:phosphate transport system permease protein